MQQSTPEPPPVGLPGRSTRRGTTRRRHRQAAQRQPARQPQPGAALRREGADRPDLPGAGDGERALPHARRDVHRAAHAGGAGPAGRRAHHARVVRPRRAGRGTSGGVAPGQGPGAPVAADASGVPPSALAAAGIGGTAAGRRGDGTARAGALLVVPGCADGGAPRAKRPGTCPRAKRTTGRTTRWRGRDARGRFAAAPLPVLRGRKAARARAGAEAAALAPWRAAVARARLVKRLMLSQERAARRAARGQNPMQRGAVGLDGVAAGVGPAAGPGRDGALGLGARSEERGQDPMQRGAAMPPTGPDGERCRAPARPRADTRAHHDRAGARGWLVA